MGYTIKKLRFHSLIDNKNYDIDIPDESVKIKLKEIINKMKSFDLSQPFTPNTLKCEKCIYNPLCDCYSDGDLNDE